MTPPGGRKKSAPNSAAAADVTQAGDDVTGKLDDVTQAAAEGEEVADVGMAEKTQIFTRIMTIIGVPLFQRANIRCLGKCFVRAITFGLN